MKKTHRYISIIVLVSCSVFAVLASCRKYLDDSINGKNVDLVCTLDITGGCFDQWELVGDGSGNYCLEPAGEYLRTLNYLTTLPSAAGGPGPLTTDSTSDAYSGTHAALLTTKSFSPMGTPLIIPGLVGTDSLDISIQNIRLGKRYTLRPTYFEGYYKYVPVGGDSALISVLLSKYNSGLHKRDTIGFAKRIYKNKVVNYNQILLPITYFKTETPDSLTLLICSSAGINFNDVMNCKGQVGSQLWIDEISFIMP